MAVRSYVLAGCDPAPSLIGEAMNEGGISGSVGECVDAWIADLEIGGASALTVKQYRWKARKALPLDSPVYALSTAILRGLVADCVRTRAPASAATFWGTMRSFTKYLHARGLTPTNLMSGVPRPRVPEPQARNLSAEALARLWAAACALDADAAPKDGIVTVSTHGGSAMRWTGRSLPLPETRHGQGALNGSSHGDSTTYRLLFQLLASTGLRRAEVAGARYEDIEGDTLREQGFMCFGRFSLDRFSGLFAESGVSDLPKLRSVVCEGHEIMDAAERRHHMTPKWATELMAQVFEDEGWNQPVSLTWRRAGSKRVPHGWQHTTVYRDGQRRTVGAGEVIGPPPQSSSGRAFWKEGRIVVTAGKSRIDQKLVLLHEIAHILTPEHHHDGVFWDKAWELFRRYGVPVRYAQKREYGYRKGARSAYIRSRRVANSPRI